MRTFIKLVLLLGFSGVIIIIAVTNYVRSHQTASLHSCYFNQMWIERAKAQWAHDNHKSDTDVPTEAEVLDYMRRITPMWCGVKFPQHPNIKAIPTCFNTNEKYILGAVGERVRCPLTQKMKAQHTDWYHEWGGIDLNDESFRQNYRM
jgi:hypothetical protein